MVKVMHEPVVFRPHGRHPPLQTAAAHRYDVLPGNVFIDDGISGTRRDRPALGRLRDLAAEGAFEVILVTAPDRLARRYAYQVVLVEEFSRDGCAVVFVPQSLGASPEAQMLLQMQGVFAEYERALSQERTRRGRLFAARQGRVKGGIRPRATRMSVRPQRPCNTSARRNPLRTMRTHHRVHGLSNPRTPRGAPLLWIW